MRTQKYLYHSKRGNTMVSRDQRTLAEKLSEAIVTVVYFHNGLIHARCGTKLIAGAWSELLQASLFWCSACLENVQLPQNITNRIPTKEKWIENQRVCQPAYQSEADEDSDD